MDINKVKEKLQNDPQKPLFLFVTATPLETDCLLEKLEPIEGMEEVEKIPLGDQTYSVARFGLHNIVHVQTKNTGAGSSGGAQNTVSKAIKNWRPNAVVMVGIACGKDPSEQKIGDVLVSKEVQNYEYLKICKNGEIELRSPRPEAGRNLVNHFINLRKWKYPTISGDSEIIPGLILSGEKKLDNNDFKTALFKQIPYAIGVEMEGFSLYSACFDYYINEWIVIKGISDWGDGSESENKKENQKLAARAAISLCLKVFSENSFKEIIEKQIVRPAKVAGLPEEFCMFVLLMSMQCSNKDYLLENDLQDISNNLLAIMGINITIDIETTLKNLQTKGLITGLIDNFFGINEKGKKSLNDYMDHHWSLFESVLKENAWQGDTTQELFNKYIIENMPYEERIKRLDKIIDFLTNYYRDICWKFEFNEKTVAVPFHLLINNDLKTIQSEIEDNVQAGNIKYDNKYLEFYEARDKATRGDRDVPKQVYNGSVYRLLDWNEIKGGIATLYIGIDKGYIDFQSTCGKIRNEIDHTIAQYEGDMAAFADMLKYRQQTMHTQNDPQKIADFLKTRVVKIGIETCVILVDKTEDGKMINPRLPIVFRGKKVAEYPEFSMVVPSGAYQAGVLMEKKEDEYFKSQIIERMDWKISVIRELGEELFGIEALERFNIEHLTDTTQFKMCEEIIDGAVCFKPTGFGIDLYLGSGNMLVTLILDYPAVLRILNKYSVEDKVGQFVKIRNKFKQLNESRATDTSEGRIYLFKLDEEFMENVVSYYIEKIEKEPLPPISPLNTINPIEFKPMIPSGVLSIIHAKLEYDALASHD